MTSIGDSTSHTLWRVEGHNMLWFQAAWGYHGNMDEKQWGYIIPSGNLLHNYGKSPCFSWEKSL